MNPHDRIYWTKDYTLFKENEVNREIKVGTAAHAKLEASIATDGWWSTEPMVVWPKDRSGKHTIVKGHHKFDIARKMKISIPYQIDEKMVPLWKREGRIGTPEWRLGDWVFSYMKAGKNSNYQVLFEYQRRTRIPMTNCIHMFGMSQNYQAMLQDIREGNLRLSDTILPGQVEEIVQFCSNLAVPFARKAGFVTTLAQLLRMKVIDRKVLKRKISLNIGVLKKKEYLKDYLTIINEVYNFREHPKVDLRTSLKNAMTEEKRKMLRKNREQPEPMQATA